MNEPKMHSPDITQDNIARIRELFPNCVTEAKDDTGDLRLAVDFDQLRQELSDHVVEGPRERYRLDWPGKRAATVAANAPIAKTLRPARDESVDFDGTENLFIEGDNLDALKLLQETYLGKVKMIYIDPPYNTGNDLIYDDNFAEKARTYLERSYQLSDEGRLVANTESNGKFHSDWLSMMHSRLKLARNLLRQDGLIFISINDIEQSNLKKLCDNVFGSRNFLGCACRVAKKANNKGDYWAPNFDYILTYSKDQSMCPVFFGGANYEAYNQIDTNGPRAGESYQLVRLYMSSLDSRPNQRYYIEAPDGTMLIPPGNTFPAEFSDGATVLPKDNDDKVWRWSIDSYLRKRDEIVVKKVRSSNLIDGNGGEVFWNVYTKTYLNDVIEKSSAKPNSLVEDFINQKGSHELNELEIPFTFAKPSSLITYLCEISKVDEGDVIMDFFAGSGTTAHAAMKLGSDLGINVKFILVQLAESLDPKKKLNKVPIEFCKENKLQPNIASIAKERIRRAGKQVLEGECHEDWQKDVGFRVLKVDSSNMKDVYYRPDEVTQQDLVEAIDNVKDGRTSEDLLFQVLVDWGVDLSLPIRSEQIQAKEVYFVDDNALIACFDKDISEALVQELAEHKPLRVLFRDSGFSTDAAKINVTQIFKQISPETDVRTL